MTLKTSSSNVNKMNGLFHQTIFKKTVLRFWPIWALYLAILIFVLPVNLYNQLRYLYLTPEDAGPLLSEEQVLVQDQIRNLLGVLDNNSITILLGVFAIVAAVAVFSYLYVARSCNMMHAFPVKRSTLFVTNYLAGYLFLAIPQGIAALVTMAICGFYRVPGIQYVAIWMLFSLGISFFFYSMAVLCCMLTGHFLAGFAFYFFFHLVYMVFANLIMLIAEEICYGLAFNGGTTDLPTMWLSPLVYLSTGNRIYFDWNINDGMQQVVEISGGGVIALYCIPAVACIALAMFLYKRRHLECAAEMTAHKFVKPMTRWMVTIVAAIGLSFWFSVVFFEGSRVFLPVMLFMIIITSWIVYFVLEMALNKKFKVFKKVRFLEWGICAVAMLLLVGVMERDVFGMEKREPSLAETKGVIVSAGHDMVITEEEQIEKILQVHQDIVDSKVEYETADKDLLDVETSYVSLEYVLWNGKTLERSYQIPVEETYMQNDTRAAGMIRSLQEEMDSAMKSWLAVNYEGMELLGGQMYVYGSEKFGEQTIQLEKEQIEVLYEAMKKDTMENHTGRYFGPEIDWDESTYLNCHINFYGELKEAPISTYDLMRALREEFETENGVTYSTEELVEPAATIAYYDGISPEDYMIDGYFDVSTTCEHTLSALLELGIIEDVSDLMDEAYYD